MIRTASLLCALLMGFAMAADDGLDLPVEKPEKASPKPPVKAVVGHPVQLPPPPPVTTPAPLPHQNPEFFGKDIPAKDSIFFVIDMSGSMDTIDPGEHESRLAIAQRELSRSVSALPDYFKFDVVSFDCSYHLWSMGLVEATDGNKSSACGWISDLRAGGSTGTGPTVAMALVLDETCDNFVLLTDGAPNCGAGDELGDWPCMLSHESQIHWANEKRVGDGHRKGRIDVFGICATGQYRTFCLDVARDATGTYTDVK